MKKKLEKHKEEKLKFDEKDLVDYLHQILQGLECVHENQIVHDDLKPENIMINKIDDKEQMRIADFGIAQTLAKTHPQQVNKKEHGSPNYMAPEVCKGLEYSYAVDCWSLGVVLHAIMLGSTPNNFRDDRELAKLFG